MNKTDYLQLRKKRLELNAQAKSTNFWIRFGIVLVCLQGCSRYVCNTTRLDGITSTSNDVLRPRITRNNTHVICINLGARIDELCVIFPTQKLFHSLLGQLWSLHTRAHSYTNTHDQLAATLLMFALFKAFEIILCMCVYTKPNIKLKAIKNHKINKYITLLPTP